MSQNCPNCQNHNPTDARFCHNCGSKLPGAVSPANTGSVSQSYSGQANSGQPIVGVGVAGVGPISGAAPFIGQPQFAGNTVDNAQPSTGISKLAIASLGLAICSLIFGLGPLSGIPAAITGWMELTAIKQGRSDRSNAWMAHVGLWGGIVISLLAVLGFMLIILVAIANAEMSNSYMYEYNGYNNYNGYNGYNGF